MAWVNRVDVSSMILAGVVLLVILGSGRQAAARIGRPR